MKQLLCVSSDLTPLNYHYQNLKTFGGILEAILGSQFHFFTLHLFPTHLIRRFPWQDDGDRRRRQCTRSIMKPCAFPQWEVIKLSYTYTFKKDHIFCFLTFSFLKHTFFKDVKNRNRNAVTYESFNQFAASSFSL